MLRHEGQQHSLSFLHASGPSLTLNVSLFLQAVLVYSIALGEQLNINLNTVTELAQVPDSQLFICFMILVDTETARPGNNSRSLRAHSSVTKTPRGSPVTYK